MSEWLTCLKCGAIYENGCACPGCEGGRPITLTLPAIFVSPDYARELSATNPVTDESVSNSRGGT